MKILLTGASGGLGTALIPQLNAAGHQVIAVSRSEKADAKIKASGTAEIIRGSIQDPAFLAEAAANVDAAIHAAFNHDVFGDPGVYESALAEDRAALTAIGNALALIGGNDKTLIYTSGTLANAGEDEASGSIKIETLARYKSEDITLSFAEKGLRSFVVKLPPVVHNGIAEHPFIATQIEGAKKSGYAAYVGEGKNVWCAAHYDDVAALIVLLLTKGESGFYHAVDEEGIPTRDISEFLAGKLNVPTKSVDLESAQKGLGLIGMLLTLGRKTTAHYTKSVTGWKPTRPGLFADLEHYKY